MNINNTSLDGFIKGAHVSFSSCLTFSLVSIDIWPMQETNSLGVAITDKSCLIMDEVDGMSAGDRGGVGALNTLIKKSKVSLSSGTFRSGRERLL